MKRFKSLDDYTTADTLYVIGGILISMVTILSLFAFFSKRNVPIYTWLIFGGMFISLLLFVLAEILDILYEIRDNLNNYGKVKKSKSS